MERAIRRAITETPIERAAEKNNTSAITPIHGATAETTRATTPIEIAEENNTRATTPIEGTEENSTSESNAIPCSQAAPRIVAAPPIISRRLDAIMSLVPECDVLIDVGCDHGKLCDRLLESGRVNLAIATDISEDSLNKARILLSKYGSRHRCQLADGLTFEVGEDIISPCVVTISGMGGLAIIKILEQRTIAVGTLILQPQNKIPEVRAYLVSHGYSIMTDMCVIDDDRFYDVISAEPSKDKAELTDIQLQWGVFYSEYNECLAAKAARIRQKILSYDKLSSEAQIKLKLCEEVIWAQKLEKL